MPSSYLLTFYTFYPKMTGKWRLNNFKFFVDCEDSGGNRGILEGNQAEANSAKLSTLSLDLTKNMRFDAENL